MYHIHLRSGITSDFPRLKKNGFSFFFHCELNHAVFQTHLRIHIKEGGDSLKLKLQLERKNSVSAVQFPSFSFSPNLGSSAAHFFLLICTHVTTLLHPSNDGAQSFLTNPPVVLSVQENLLFLFYRKHLPTHFPFDSLSCNALLIQRHLNLLSTTCSASLTLQNTTPTTFTMRKSTIGPQPEEKEVGPKCFCFFG